MLSTNCFDFMLSLNMCALNEQKVVFTEEIVDDDEPIVLAPIAETAVEETKVITRLWMQSRKLKINISNELLNDLDRLNVNFKLN